MPASALPAAVIPRREPQRLMLNTVEPIAEDIERTPLSLAPQKAPDPLPSPRANARVATTWIRSWIFGMPRWQEDRYTGRPWQPNEGSAIPRGSMTPFEDGSNIRLPASTAYGSQMEIG